MIRAFAFCISVLGFVSTVYAQGALENPAPSSRQSGIGLVSGWKCTASHLTATIDGSSPFFIPHGSARGDTQGVCGDIDNGFGLLLNWNLFPDGPHTIRLFDGGVQFASATFTTQSLGGEFLTGLNKSVTVSNFPAAGQTTTLQWSQAAQNFIVSGFAGGEGGGFPNVAGQWRTSFDFVDENCNFLSVPPDLPTHLNFTFTVTQNGATIIMDDGSLPLTGEVESDSNFVVVSDPNINTAGTCTYGLVAGISGNFFDQIAALAFVADRISGSCAGISLPCAIAYAGTITKLSSALTAQEQSDSTPIENLRARIRGAFPRQ
ncbi:MAG: hypothetical protein AB7P69_03820 [Candidatus Binatia bacterium]